MTDAFLNYNSLLCVLLKHYKCAYGEYENFKCPHCVQMYAGGYLQKQNYNFNYHFSSDWNDSVKCASGNKTSFLDRKLIHLILGLSFFKHIISRRKWNVLLVITLHINLINLCYIFNLCCYYI